MATPPPSAGGSPLTIPPETEQKFGELIGLIRTSESMNDEERQYWINILPVMTPEQVQNLRQILVNEREQLAAIDKKYQREIEQMGREELLRRTEEQRRQRRREREQAQRTAAQQEEEAAAALLRKIEAADA